MPPAFTLSQDQTLRFISVPASLPEDIAVQRRHHQDINEQTRTLWFAPIAMTFATANRNSFKAYCNASKRYASERPKAKPTRSKFYSNPDRRSGHSISPVLAHATRGRRQRIPS